MPQDSAEFARLEDNSTNVRFFHNLSHRMRAGQCGVGDLQLVRIEDRGLGYSTELKDCGHEAGHDRRTRPWGCRTIERIIAERPATARPSERCRSGSRSPSGSRTPSSGSAERQAQGGEDAAVIHGTIQVLVIWIASACLWASPSARRSHGATNRVGSETTTAPASPRGLLCNPCARWRGNSINSMPSTTLVVRV